MSAFDEDTAVTPAGSGTYRGRVTPRWDIAGAPNGGYLMSLMLRAATGEVPHPDPLTATAHFLARTESDADCLVDVDVIRRGRRYTTVSVGLRQGERERIRMLATYGDLVATEGPTDVTRTAPPMRPVTDLVDVGGDPGPVAIARQFRYRTEARLWPSAVSEAPPEQSAAAVSGYIRFRDDREPDLLAMPLIADAFPPAVFNRRPFAWVPTLELTVHFRARPAPGWLAAHLSTDFVVDGLLEEDGELWDSTGRLVALSRQFAQLT